MKTAVQQLLDRYPQQIWRGRDQGRQENGVAPQHQGLEHLLGQWPRGAITEIHSQVEGIGELRLVLPAIAALSQQEERWVLWCHPPHIPYAPALVAAGVRLERMLMVHPRQDQDQLWVLESALQSGTCSAVLAWPPALDRSSSRRLQLAAETGNSLAFFFFRDALSNPQSSAALRLRLQPAEAGVRVQVEKRRGAQPQEGNTPLNAGLQLPLAI